MATNKINRTTLQNQTQKLIAGLQKHAQTVPSLVLGGATFTNAEIVAVLQERLASANTVQGTRALWQNAVKADKDERAKHKAFVSGLRQALGVAFAGSVDTLADFGLVARKKAVLTPKQRTDAAAKARATRAARHTMGSKQKAKVKGTAPAAGPAPAAGTASSPGAAGASSGATPPTATVAPTPAPGVAPPPAPGVAPPAKP